MKKNLIKIAIAFVVTFIFITNVGAVSLGEFGETVVQEGDYNSVRFIAGNNVTNKAVIDGISFAAGNNVVSEATVPYGFYAGNIVNISDNIEKDLFIAGNSVTVGPNAVVGRDLFVAASSVVIKSNVGRDLRAGGETVTLKGITINGDAYVDADKIVLDEETVITGKLRYPDTAEVVDIDKASIGNIETYHVTVETEKEEGFFESFKVTLFITSLVAGLITLFIILGLLPDLRHKIEKVDLNAEEILITAAIGLGILICVPIVSLFTIFTGVLTPITLIVLAIYVICIYLSRLFAAYFVGNIVSKKLFESKKNNLFIASVLIGVILVELVCLIPFIGGLVKFVLLVYGLGLILKLIKSNIKKK